MTTIAIVEYGTGNHRSVLNALRLVAPDAKVFITHDRQTILNADRVVLPGQGAMRSCVESLHRYHLSDTLFEVSRTKPLLGICIGLQMLFEQSDEDDADGLGLFSGRVCKLGGPAFAHTSDDPLREHFKVPHMGWNQVLQCRAHPLWAKITDNTHFYFAHSYHVVPSQLDVRVAQTDYGITFTSAIARDNVFAVQFHPEKSAHAGLRMFRNFVDWNP